MLQVGDIVYIKKNNRKNLFRIKDINGDKIILFGYNNRQIITVDVSDIEVASKESIENSHKMERKIQNRIVTTSKARRMYPALFGRILHIDGDSDFLKSCMELYQELDIYAYGLNIQEKKIHEQIEKIILQITPDIIVITGHDQYNGKGLRELSNYENTPYFIEAIRKIRKHFSDTVIIAGACGSNFEALIANGANFASSPKRINTHTYDPAVVAIKVATTPVDRKVDFANILKYIENGKDALGGIETSGKMKLLL